MTSEQTVRTDTAGAQATDSTVGATVRDEETAEELFDTVVSGYWNVLSGHPALFVVFAMFGAVRAAVYVLRQVFEIP